MVIIGADVSGNMKGYGQSRHIAFVLCTKESMNRNYKKIGVTNIHMRFFKDSKKKKIFQNLKFNNTDFIGLCLNVEREKTINSIFNDPNFRSNISKSKLQKHFDYLLFQTISDIIKSFATYRKYEIKDIIMQCDSDMSKTGKNWHMKIEHKGKAYEIADALAWCNEHGVDIKYSIEIDLVVELYQKMKCKFVK